MPSHDVLATSAVLAEPVDELDVRPPDPHGYVTTTGSTTRKAATQRAPFRDRLTEADMRACGRPAAAMAIGVEAVLAVVQRRLAPAHLRPGTGH